MKHYKIFKYLPLCMLFLSGCNAVAPKQSALISPDGAAPQHAGTVTTPPQNISTSAVSPMQSTASIEAPVQISAEAQTKIAIPDTGTTTLAANAPIANAETSFTKQNAETGQVDVWQRIRNGLAMPEMDNKLVTQFEHWYAARPEYIERMTERARRYLYFIVDEVEKRKMPMEIALLPMIESAFNPTANSSARASGIWQFIPSTGKNFGMQQNWWYDGRRDVISATKGALDYLEQLHTMFGSWDLALAAYNAGENAVIRAQARNRKLKRPTDYMSIRLPRETRQYVPKLMAVRNIIRYPSSFGLVLADIPNRPYFAEVSTTKHIDVELAAEMAGISMEEFAALNPAHSRPVILQKGDEVLLLPVESVNTFQANLIKAEQPLVSWQACPTHKGENLDSIAEKYGIAPEKLKTVNGIHRSIKTSNGQTLLVPLNGEQPDAEFTAFNTHLPPTDNSLLNAIKHVVRKGDTLSGIARRYHVNLASLKSWNQGVRILRPGQNIWVAQPSYPSRNANNIKRTTTNVKKPVHPSKM